MIFRSNRSFFAILTACAALSLTCQADASSIVKADNATALNITTSWIGNVVPDSGDIAVWSGSYAANRTAVLGADLSWQGIQIGSTTGAATSMAISGSNILTLGSSGVDMSAATVNLTLSSTLALNVAQTWNIASGRVLLISGANTGTATISLAGSGTFALNNNQAFGTGALSLGSGVNLTSATTTSRTVSNAVSLNGDISVTMTGASSSVFLFDGGMDVGSATRTISVVNANGSATNPTLAFGGGGAAGGEQITGSGTLVLANGNAGVTPTVAVRMGTSGADSPVFHTGVSIGSGVSVYFYASNVFSTDTDLTIQSGGVLNMSNNGGSAASQTVRSLNGSGTVTNNATTANGAVLTIDGGTSTATNIFSGVIQSQVQSGTIGPVSVTKAGSNTQIFAGTNSYTGQTQINAGTLLINGAHSEASPVVAANSVSGYGSTTNGHFKVASGAILGGSGSISGNNATANSNLIYVQSGGRIDPGSQGIGTFTVDGTNLTGSNSHSLNMNSGAEFDFDLSGSGGISDRIDFWGYSSGDVLLNANAINLTLDGSLAAGTYTVSLFRFYSDNGVTGVNSGLLSGLTIGTLGSGISGTPTLNFNAGGNTIDLTYTVVPEPSLVALVGLGFALVLWRGRPRASVLR